MTDKDRKALIAAAIIMAGVAGTAYVLPAVMLWLGEISSVAAGAFALLFLFCFFIIFWLRARSQGRD